MAFPEPVGKCRPPFPFSWRPWRVTLPARCGCTSTKAERFPSGPNTVQENERHFGE